MPFKNKKKYNESNKILLFFLEALALYMHVCYMHETCDMAVDIFLNRKHGKGLGLNRTRASFGEKIVFVFVLHEG